MKFSVVPDSSERKKTVILSAGSLAARSSVSMTSASLLCEYACDELGGTVDDDGTLRLGERTVKLIACPIGIEAKEFADMATQERALETFERVTRSLVGIIGCVVGLKVLH